MRKREQGKLHMESVLALLVFGVFSCCVVFVLMAGARVYNRVNQRDTDAAAMRACVQYLATKVRQAPETVYVTDFGDGDALVLTEEINGQQYAAWVYCHSGWLCELFGEEDGTFSPTDGERVLEAKALRLMLENDLLIGTVTMPDGSTAELALDIRGGAA